MREKQRNGTRSLAALVNEVHTKYFIQYWNIQSEHVEGGVEFCLHLTPVVSSFPVVNQFFHDGTWNAIVPSFVWWKLDCVWDYSSALNALSDPIKCLLVNIDFEGPGLAVSHDRRCLRIFIEAARRT